MDNERWVLLDSSNWEPLSQSEIDLGWHFCPEMDGLLIGPGMVEIWCCDCHPWTDEQRRAAKEDGWIDIKDLPF